MLTHVRTCVYVCVRVSVNVGTNAHTLYAFMCVNLCYMYVCDIEDLKEHLLSCNIGVV